MNFLGKISFILSLFCFTVVLGLKWAMSGWMPFFDLGFIFAAVFFLISIVTNYKFFKNLFHSESLFFLGRSALTVVLFFALLIGLNYVVARQTSPVDITANKIHSFSSLTQSLVKAINNPVRFVYFYVDGPQAELFKDRVRKEVRRYQNLNDKLKFESHSLFKRPDLAKEFKVGNEESALYIQYKERVERVSNLEEVDITNALLRLTKPIKKIYFLSLGDSRQLSDSSAFGLSGLTAQLQRLHYSLEDLKDFSEIPQDTAVLALVGPREPLKMKDLDLIRSYLDGGGAMLLTLDPGENHGLKPLLRDYGIEFEDNFVFTDQVQAGQSPLLVPTHRGLAEHEISEQLQEGENPYLFISASLAIVSTTKENQKVVPILEHLPTSVGRSDISPQSPIITKGRQFAGLLSQGGEQNIYRFLVVSDSDFMTNQFYLRPGNFTFALNLFSYLSKDEDLLKIKVPQAETTYLLLTQTQMNLFFLFFVLPFSALFFILGLFFRLRRFF